MQSINEVSLKECCIIIVNDCLTSLCLLAINFVDKKESLRVHNVVLSSDLIFTEHELKYLLFNIVNIIMYIHHLWIMLLTVIMLFYGRNKWPTDM